MKADCLTLIVIPLGVYPDKRIEGVGSTGGGLCLVNAQSRTGSLFSFVFPADVLCSVEFERTDFGGPSVLEWVRLTLFKATSP